jgi:hypothetical protein
MKGEMGNKKKSSMYASCPAWKKTLVNPKRYSLSGILSPLRIEAIAGFGVLGVMGDFGYQEVVAFHELRIDKAVGETETCDTDTSFSFSLLSPSFSHLLSSNLSLPLSLL